jgi:hypothetical protein
MNEDAVSSDDHSNIVKLCAKIGSSRLAVKYLGTDAAREYRRKYIVAAKSSIREVMAACA